MVLCCDRGCSSGLPPASHRACRISRPVCQMSSKSLWQLVMPQRGPCMVTHSDLQMPSATQSLSYASAQINTNTETLLWAHSTPCPVVSSSILPLTQPSWTTLGAQSVPQGVAACVLMLLMPYVNCDCAGLEGDMRTQGVYFVTLPSMLEQSWHGWPTSLKTTTPEIRQNHGLQTQIWPLFILHDKKWVCNPDHKWTKGCPGFFSVGRGNYNMVKLIRFQTSLTWFPTKRRCSPNRKSFSMSSITIMCCRDI